MTEISSIGKYCLGALAGILLVVGCGSGGGASVGSADAVDLAQVNDQLLCTGSPFELVNDDRRAITCMAGSTPGVQTFQNFNQIAQDGWILAKVSVESGTGVLLFYR